MSAELSYEKWAKDMCSLLDAVEKALSDDDLDRARTLIQGRFSMAEEHGLIIEIIGSQTDRMQ